MPPLSALKQIPLWDLKHGLFADRSSHEIPPGGCESCSNLLYVDGQVRPRPGFAEAYATGDVQVAHHITQWTPLIGSPVFLRATRGGSNEVRIYRWSAGWIAAGGPFTNATLSTIVPTSANFKGFWYYAPGEYDLLVFDGTTTVTVDSLQPDTALQPPNDPRFVAANDTRLFLANVLDDSGVRVSYRVCWSDFLNANVWNGGVGAGSSGFQDLASDNYEITGLYTLTEMIMVFKKNSTYIGRFVGGRKQYEFRPLYRGIGCIAHATIRELENGALIWLGDDAVYYAFPGQQPQSIGEAIHDRIRALCELTVMERASAIYDRTNHFYHLILPEAGTSRCCIILSVNLKDYGWWEGRIASTGPFLNVVDTHELKSNWGSQLLVSCEDAKIYEFSFSYTDDAGTAWTTSWVSGLYSILQLTNGQSESAMVQSVRAFAATGNVTLSVIRGDGLDRFTETSFGTQQFNGTAALLRNDRTDSAEHFKIKMVHSTISTAAKIEGLQVGLRFKGNTKGQKP